MSLFDGNTSIEFAKAPYGTLGSPLFTLMSEILLLIAVFILFIIIRNFCVEFRRNKK